MVERYDAAIIGCGISGASLAFNLATKGLKVIVLERDRPAAGGTGLSAAIIRQHYSTRLMARLAHAAVGIFSTAAACVGRDMGYRRAGYFFLVPPDQAETARSNVAMQTELGIRTEMLGLDRLARMAPWLNLDGVGDAAYEVDGGYADPESATEVFLEAATAKGAVSRMRTPARAILRNADRVTGVLTDDGPIETGLVVNAAGPWAAALAASAQIELTMRTVREQDTVWEGRPGRPLPEQSISNAVDAIYIRPLGERRYVVGRGFPKAYFDVDPNNYKKTADDDFIADVQTRLVRRIPTMDGARLVNAYGALYDVTVDWYPYVGPRNGLAGYADFCGGSGHGFKIAPAIARELADWLVDAKVAADFAQLSYDRVGSGRMFVQSYGGNRG